MRRIFSIAHSHFQKDHEFNPTNIHFESLTLNPSPTAILNILCKQFLHANVSAILYMMNYEQYGRSTASAQYFLQVINLHSMSCVWLNAFLFSWPAIWESPSSVGTQTTRVSSGEHRNRHFNCNWRHQSSIRRLPCWAYWSATSGISSRLSHRKSPDTMISFRFETLNLWR